VGEFVDMERSRIAKMHRTADRQPPGAVDELDGEGSS
jgi:hypothetical protein